VKEIENEVFKQDPYWRGADGAATVALDSNNVLWLFSDTFIDQSGSGKRSRSKFMIRNSIAIQYSDSANAKLNFYYKGSSRKPDDFFKIPGKNWFWTGHGTMLKNKLLIFLMEQTATNTGMGFEAVGWYLAIIDNPNDSPADWKINYFKGPETFGVIVGSSAALSDENYLYAFGVKEPATHETYLLRFEISKIIDGDLSSPEWWVNNTWSRTLTEEPKSSLLFIGQTEFSVHYDPKLRQFIQIQTFGFGKASLGYRMADQLTGPWSEPVMFFKPVLKDEKEFVYTANAHPEIRSNEILVTYNINNGDFGKLLNNEDIYFPKIIKVSIEKVR